MRGSHGKSADLLPRVWLVTDERIPRRDLLRGVRRLPPGAGVLLRHRATKGRKRRALLSAILRARSGPLTVLVADAAGSARTPWRAWSGAAGVHLGRANHRRMGQRSAGGIMSASAHDLAELRAAGRAGADLIFLSPLFPTASHPGAPVLGMSRFAALARRSPVPVIALGGIHPRHARLVNALGAHGYAAIDGLTKRRR